MQIVLVVAGAVSAETGLLRAQIAGNALQGWYNSTSGLWDSCGWWNGANCMTVLADLAAMDPFMLKTAREVFANTYSRAPAVNPMPYINKVVVNGNVQTNYAGNWPNVQIETYNPEVTTTVAPLDWVDGYYDDDGWWALAWIAAYDRTLEENYLETAEGIFLNMTSGWPTNCNNGGIWWDTTKTYANAIANELFMSVAAHLANRPTKSGKSYYVDWATREWDWFKASGMINKEGAINDGLTTDCKNNGQNVWSYNQGVVLGALVELNKAAPDASFLPAAASIAMAGIAHLTDANGVLHDTCEPSCGPDGSQFKGIFMRNLQALNSAAPDAKYSHVITASANSIWANDRNSWNQFSLDWAGPFVQTANASTHSSALEALVAAINVS